MSDKSVEECDCVSIWNESCLIWANNNSEFVGSGFTLPQYQQCSDQNVIREEFVFSAVNSKWFCVA